MKEIERAIEDREVFPNLVFCIFSKKSGRQLRMRSGKSSWRQIGHAKNALWQCLDNTIDHMRGDMDYIAWRTRKKEIKEQILALVEIR